MSCFRVRYSLTPLTRLFRSQSQASLYNQSRFLRGRGGQTFPKSQSQSIRSSNKHRHRAVDQDRQRRKRSSKRLTRTTTARKANLEDEKSVDISHHAKIREITEILAKELALDAQSVLKLTERVKALLLSTRTIAAQDEVMMMRGENETRTLEKLKKAYVVSALLDNIEAFDEKNMKTTTTTTTTTTNEIKRKIIEHEVIREYRKEISRFAYLRINSFGKNKSKNRPKDRASNQKKLRQGLSRVDMRVEHRRWCVACQKLVKKEEALSATKVLIADIDEDNEKGEEEQTLTTSTRKDRRKKNGTTTQSLTYTIITHDHKKTSKENKAPQGRSLFVCRRLCCVKMVNSKRVASTLKYKKRVDDEIARELSKLAEKAEQEDFVDSSTWMLVKPGLQVPHRWSEPPKWIERSS